ncbi:MAG: hypothetical protein JO276_11020 [Sphingomonadaceae bacterium]|nr:hypothetical protein [Sphingomonadaceae bacterium]
MGRTILAVIGGLVAWALVATVLDIGLRLALTGYHAAEATLAFTLTMKLARLTLAAIASLAAGAVIGAIAPSSRLAPWIAGAIMLALFLPEHIRIWPLLPVWYHLFFLITLAPLVVLGARLRLKRSDAGRSGSAAAPA